MNKYNIGIDISGSVQHVLEVMAEDIGSAKNEWARITGHSDPLWNTSSYTYFGWPVIETTLPALERKANPNPFQY